MFLKSTALTACVVAALMFGAAVAHADPSVGDFDKTQYSNVWTPTFEEDGGQTITDGTFATHLSADGKCLWILAILPESLVDNQWDPDLDVGYGPGGHKLSKLTGSDKAEFTLMGKDANGQDVTVEFIYDLIDEDGTNFVYGMDGDGKVQEDGGLGDATVKASIVDGSTTTWKMWDDGNYPGAFDDGDDSSSPAANAPGWINFIGYEIKVDLDTLGLSDVEAALASVHASPNKKDGKNQWNVTDLDPDPNPNPNPVPEPGTMALLGLGLLGLAWNRRRQRDRA